MMMNGSEGHSAMTCRRQGLDSRWLVSDGQQAVVPRRGRVPALQPAHRHSPLRRHTDAGTASTRTTWNQIPPTRNGNTTRTTTTRTTWSMRTGCSRCERSCRERGTRRGGGRQRTASADGRIERIERRRTSPRADADELARRVASLTTDCPSRCKYKKLCYCRGTARGTCE